MPDAPTEDLPAIDASALLKAYVASGCADDAFQKIVDSLSGLIYSSALRRTSDHSLAEEVTQNVFAGLVQKADQLQNHPALLAWIFKATRFEASKALREESRRKKRDAAMAAENPLSHDSGNEAWQDAVPELDAALDRLSKQERQIILQRFFEGRKFADIARLNGTTEPASKMRVKRTLEKLSRLLSARGVSLSGVAIASALGAELARAAPAAALVKLTPSAIASSTATTSGLFLNATEIMSTAKAITATSAAVISIVAVPFFLQESKADKLRKTIRATEQSQIIARQQLEERPSRPKTLAEHAENSNARVVQDLLSGSGKIDAHTLVADLMAALTNEDFFQMLKIVMPLHKLGEGEFENLIAEIQDYRGPETSKQVSLQLLSNFTPMVADPADSLNRLLAIGGKGHAFGPLLSRWAKDDPDSALAWFEEQRESGKTVGKGLFESSDQQIFDAILRGTFSNDPARAVDLYLNAGAHVEKFTVFETESLIPDLADLAITSGDGTQFRRLLDAHTNSNHRQHIIAVALFASFENAPVAEVVDFVTEYMADSEERDQALEKHLVGRLDLGIDGQVTAITTHLSADQSGEVIERAVLRQVSSDAETAVDAWLEEMPPGDIRESGLRGAIKAYTRKSQFDKAIELALQIEDPKEREELLSEINTRSATPASE